MSDIFKTLYKITPGMQRIFNKIPIVTQPNLSTYLLLAWKINISKFIFIALIERKSQWNYSKYLNITIYYVDMSVTFYCLQPVCYVELLLMP